MSDSLSEARDLLHSHRWSEAYELLKGVPDRNAAGEMMLAEASTWIGRLDEALEAQQRAVAAAEASGDTRLASLACTGIGEAFFHRLQPEMGQTWFRRAEALLEDSEDGYERAWLLRMKAQMGVSNEEALRLTDRVLELAEQIGSHDLAAIARHDRGRLLVEMGRLDEGMALMEDVMTDVLSGRLDADLTGRIYCNMISTCERLTDYRRASEWDRAAKGWCEKVAHLAAYPGVCRVKRAQVKRVQGSLDEAEAEAHRAVSELESFLDIGALAWVEIGEVRRRRGDQAGALEAFSQARAHGGDPQPGLALVCLARGDVNEARAMLEESLSDATDFLDRARLLPAYAQVVSAAGDVVALDAIAGEMSSLADAYRSSALVAGAATCQGLAALAGGRSEEAIRALRAAVQSWTETRAPFEAAETHRLLGTAYAEAGRPNQAEVERAAAARLFGELGVGPPPPSSQQVAILFSDIVSSTELISAVGDQAWAHLLRWHDQTLRRLFVAHGGEERNHAGDGFLVTFSDAGQGVACAVAIQQALEQHRVSNGFAPEVRIGLHGGSAAMVDGTLTGADVHKAARVAGTGKPGEIVVTEVILGAIAGFRTSGRRSMSLKGIVEPVEVASIDWR